MHRNTWKLHNFYQACKQRIITHLSTKFTNTELVTSQPGSSLLAPPTASCYAPYSHRQIVILKSAFSRLNSSPNQNRHYATVLTQASQHYRCRIGVEIQLLRRWTPSWLLTHSTTLSLSLQPQWLLIQSSGLVSGVSLLIKSVLVLTGMYFSARSVQSLSPAVHAVSFSATRNFIAEIVEKAGPAVVFIEIKGGHPKSGKRVTLANGSGFLVRSNGLILTNAHVVANKSKATVKLHDGSSYEGSVVVVDPVCDLAILKIDCQKPLPTIPLGKSSSIRPGEFVAAMGSPLSLHKTVTVGIVSSNLRGSKELGMNNKNIEYIQTDATIGLGNSGGPLVNLDGKAIGINTLKLTEGISFAIPADYAIELLDKADNIASSGDTSKPNYLPQGKETSKRRYMGITMLQLTPTIVMELKDKIKLFPEVSDGVYIHKVVVSSPAYAAGLHAGDIIVDINGSKIESPADVYKMIENFEILKVTVVRGKFKEVYKVVTENL